MITVHFHGFVICVVRDNTVTVSLVNSLASNATMLNHLQSLFVDGGIVRNTFESPLLAHKGRFDERGDAANMGWDLSGLALSGGAVGELTLADADPRAEHPSKAAPDWRPLHWIVQADRLVPGRSIKEEYTRLSDKVASSITLRGGRLASGVPREGGGADWVWFIRPGYIQAISDVIDWSTDAGPLTLAVTDGAGTSRGEIEIADGAEVWVSNEAAPRDVAIVDGLLKQVPGKAPTRPRCSDYLGYLEAFAAPPDELESIQVQALYPWNVKKSYDGGHCFGILVRR